MVGVQEPGAVLPAGEGDSLLVLVKFFTKHLVFDFRLEGFIVNVSHVDGMVG